MAQLLNRTRQKKFIKNFKQLPSEELVLQSKYKNVVFVYTVHINNQQTQNFWLKYVFLPEIFVN